MTSSRRSARERLLEAADRLFYNEGIRSVGIDRVLDESGVAKGSLYYNFGGKDDLVRAYLQNRHATWAARLDEKIAAQAAPRARILAIFDGLAELFAEPGFRGCAFLNAAAEAQPGSAEDLATKDFRTWLHALFGALVEEAGHRDPGRLTTQLVLLYDGANIAAALDADPRAAEAAREAAEALLTVHDVSKAPRSGADPL
ncbi:TetR/AcrR family transcriptional regulator [Actinoplanes sp. NPDC026619]|uniref:TetR/AcrR family transcriptional regulator n=1 Tax=Actinoplanes sp. NPDC026619 TaxID=3155798 RepID=UPI0034098731